MLTPISENSLACQSLRSGESTQAIVASCHLNLLPDYFIIMSMSRWVQQDNDKKFIANGFKASFQTKASLSHSMSVEMVLGEEKVSAVLC